MADLVSTDLTRPVATILLEHVLPQARVALAGHEPGGALPEIGPGGGYALTQYATQVPNRTLVGLEFDKPSVDLAPSTIAAAGGW